MPQRSVADGFSTLLYGGQGWSRAEQDWEVQAEDGELQSSAAKAKGATPRLGKNGLQRHAKPCRDWPHTLQRANPSLHPQAIRLLRRVVHLPLSGHAYWYSRDVSEQAADCFGTSASFPLPLQPYARPSDRQHNTNHDDCRCFPPRLWQTGAAKGAEWKLWTSLQLLLAVTSPNQDFSTQD